MRYQLVEHYHSATVSDRQVRSNNAVPSRPAGVDSISYLGFFKDAQVHVGLVRPPKRQLQSPVSSVPNIIGSKPYWHPPPCRITGTPTHPPPIDAFLSPDPDDLPACSCIPLSLSWSRSTPAGLTSPFPSLFPSPFSPILLLCFVHLNMGYSVAP